MAFGAFHPGKPEMQISTLQVALDDIHHIGAPEAVPSFIAVIPKHFQLLEMILRAAVIVAVPGAAGTVIVGKELHVREHEARCVPASSGRQLDDMQPRVPRQFPVVESKGCLRRLISFLKDRQGLGNVESFFEQGPWIVHEHTGSHRLGRIDDAAAPDRHHGIDLFLFCPGPRPNTI